VLMTMRGGRAPQWDGLAKYGPDPQPEVPARVVVPRTWMAGMADEPICKQYVDGELPDAEIARRSGVMIGMSWGIVGGGRVPGRCRACDLASAFERVNPGSVHFLRRLAVMPTQVGEKNLCDTRQFTGFYTIDGPAYAGLTRLRRRALIASKGVAGRPSPDPSSLPALCAGLIGHPGTGGWAGDCPEHYGTSTASVRRRHRRAAGASRRSRNRRIQPRTG